VFILQADHLTVCSIRDFGSTHRRERVSTYASMVVHISVNKSACAYKHFSPSSELAICSQNTLLPSLQPY